MRAPDEPVPPVSDRDDEIERIRSFASALAGAWTTVEVLETALRHLVEAAGAATGGAALLVAGRLVPADSLGAADLGEAPASIALEARHPLAVAARTGSAVYVPDGATLAREFGDVPADVMTRRPAAAAFPLLGPDGPIGAIGVAFDRPRELGAPERRLLELIGLLASGALVRARSLEAERRARTAAELAAERRRRLQDVATALSGPVEPEAVARRLVEAAMDGLGAPLGWVSIVPGGTSTARLLFAAGHPAATVEAWRSIPLDRATPLTDVIRTGRPILIESARERSARYPGLRGAGGMDGIEGSAIVPLDIAGTTFGALAVSFADPHAFDPDETWFLASLAAQGSQAIDRARLFEALRERDERMRFALAASGTGTWEWEIASDRLVWSSEVSVSHGLPAGDAPADFAAYLQLVHPDDREMVLERVRASIEDGASYDAEFRLLRPDGRVRWTQGSGRVVFDAEGRPVRMVGTARDITDRKSAEAERDRLAEAEREAARMRDAFIGVVSHELRTPITTIYGGTRVLARRGDELEPAARDEILADIVAESDRLYRLVEDLLVLTRVERGTLDVGDEPVHLARLVARVVGSERGRWPGVSFRVEVPPNLPSVRGEDTYVEQVLRNLLGNAAKYGGEGSTVTVEAAGDEATVTVAVLDEGPGIDEAEADRLFDLFYRSPTVAGAVSGAGIGLFVCHRLVAAMGGSIRAERRAGGGAAFLVTLPRYLDDDAG